MFSQRRVYFMIVFMLVFSGCALTNTNKSVEVKQDNIEKPIKIKEKKAEVKKKSFNYKYCNKNIMIMNHASKYIQEEFSKGYFIQKDIVGAKAQLFLIENNSKSIFAKNINNALKSYNIQYSHAKKNKCNLNKFKISPLTKIKLEIKKLEKNMLKKEDKK